MRRGFASRFLQATGDIPSLQAVLGHYSIQVTMRYAHMVTSTGTPTSTPVSD